MISWGVPGRAGPLDEIRDRIAAHARPGLQTPIDGLLLSKTATRPAAPEYSLTEPLLVVMAEGGKRLLLGDKIYEYGPGDCLVVTANLPVTGHWIDADRSGQALGMGVVLRPGAIGALLLQVSPGRWSRGTPAVPAIATGQASPELLDVAARMLRLLDHPADAAVLAPLITQEILWGRPPGPRGGTNG